LPNFDDGHGVSQLHDAIQRVHMTSCRAPVEPGRVYTRTELRDATRHSRFGDRLLVTYDEPVHDVETSWVAAALDDQGRLVHIESGASAVVATA
jgi:hypothetical protein